MMKTKEGDFGPQSPADCALESTDSMAKFVEMWEGKELGGWLGIS
jgi:hypothetical protein